MLLKDAKQVFVGTTPAKAVYAGSTLVWPTAVLPRRNLCPNPSGNTQTAPWYNFGVAATFTLAQRPADGSLVVDGRDMTYLRMTYTVPAPIATNQVGPSIGGLADHNVLIPPSAIGKQLTTSIWMRESAVGHEQQIWHRFYTAANGSLGTGYFGTPVSNGSGWTKFTFTSVVPTNAHHVRIIIFSAVGPLIAAGDTIDFGACLVEADNKVLAYFDGDSTDTPTTDYSWEGTRGASPSALGPAPVSAPTNLGQGGDWVSKGWGTKGYIVAGNTDVASLPAGVTYTNAGAGYSWAAISSHSCAMRLPPPSTDSTEGCWYHASLGSTTLTFASAFKGTLRAYFLSRSPDDRTQKIGVYLNGVLRNEFTLTGTDPATWFGSGYDSPVFNPGGRWLGWDLDLAAGSVLRVDATYIYGGNAVVAGFTFD